MSGNDMSYYERIFLRALISARVDFGQKNEQQRSLVERNKERLQVAQIATKEYLGSDLKEYLQRFEVLETQRQGLDFEIDDLIKEADFEKWYNEVPTEGVQLNDLPKESKIAKLIEKIMERQREISQQQKEIESMMKLTGPEIREKFSQISGKLDLNELLDGGADSVAAVLDQKNALNKDRQRARAE
jgi:hypothetical protein